MSGTCGPTCGTPFARFDPDSSSWRTSEATSLWDLTLSSLTLPSWGCLHGGELSERPTPELPTDERACSSLLATPSVVDMGSAYSPEAWEAWRQEQRRTHANGNGHGESLTQQAIAMLPTPKASNNENESSAWANGPNLGEAIASLGASTSPRSDAGSTSSDDQHPHLPFPEPLDATD